MSFVNYILEGLGSAGLNAAFALRIYYSNANIFLSARTSTPYTKQKNYCNLNVIIYSALIRHCIATRYIAMQLSDSQNAGTKAEGYLCA